MASTAVETSHGSIALSSFTITLQLLAGALLVGGKGDRVTKG